MLSLHFARHWRAASVVLLLVVLVGAIVPVIWLWPDRRHVLSMFGGMDKWAHALTFAFLAVWFAGQYRKDAYWRIALGLLGFGIVIELCQRMVGYRSAEWFDVAADAIGIIVGLSIAAAGFGGWCMRYESWYLNRRA